jgi:hypothetical protein
MATDEEIRETLERMHAADEARRSATPSTPEFHNAAADVERQARRVFELALESEVRAELDRGPRESPDPLDDI